MRLNYPLTGEWVRTLGGLPAPCAFWGVTHKQPPGYPEYEGVMWLHNPWFIGVANCRAVMGLHEVFSELRNIQQYIWNARWLPFQSQMA